MAAAPKMQENKFPTLDRLGVQLSADEKIDAAGIASQWFTSFAQSLESANPQSVHDLLLPNAFWRDLLALTWDFRTVYAGDILIFLKDRLPGAKISKVSFDAQSVQLTRPMPDMVWIQASFTFETELGACSGIVRLMPTSSGAWKAYTVFTNLEDLHGHPEMVGKRREQEANHTSWLEKRSKEVECVGEDEQPAVLIIGGGQSGLEVPARLKYLGIKSLVIEREDRIGHTWRNRYEALCLHDTVWFDHMPYLPFPSTWPVWAPASKLAEWLEHYAAALELNVWTSTKILRISQDPRTLHWTIELQRGNGSIRELSVKHVVGAIGFASGRIIMPDIPGKCDFRGETLHSSSYRRAKDYVGRRVVVVGSATSAHDVCRDLYDHGIDVTMIQRSSTNVTSVKGLHTMIISKLYNEDSDPNVSDRVAASLPRWASKELTQRVMHHIGQTIDKDLLDGLKKVGFRMNKGDEDCGPLFQVYNKLGGFHMDVGGGQLVVEGKIKLKNDSLIARFTKTGLEFENGSKLEANVVIFATGYTLVRDTFHEILGDDLSKKLKPIWGLNPEGELNSLFRGSGIPHFWTTLGNLGLCRFHSKHLALQIKAIEEELWDGKRYTLQE